MAKSTSSRLNSLGPGALDFGVGPDQLLGGEGLARVDAAEQAVRVHVDPRVDPLHRPVGRTRAVGPFEKLRQGRASGLASGGIESFVVTVAGASVSRLVVVRRRSGGFDFGERRFDLRAYKLIKPSAYSSIVVRSDPIP